MKRILFVLCFFLLGLSFVSALGYCDDGVDNDGDGYVDTTDFACLDSTDASERDYGYQIAVAASVDSTCLVTLENSGTSCVVDHYDTLSWLIAYFSPSSFDCLAYYSSDYGDFTSYDSTHPYTALAVADCVYDHYSDYSSQISSAYTSLDSTHKSFVEDSCFQAYYDTYASACSAVIVDSGCHDDSDCFGATPYCDPVDFTCTECTQDSHCIGYACNSGGSPNTCYTSCTDDSECSSDAACVLEGTEHLHECIVCEDGDGGLDYGVASSSSGVQYASREYVENSDACDISSLLNVHEEMCYSANGHLYNFYGVDSCVTVLGEGYVCSFGACVYTPVTTETDCTNGLDDDSDGDVDCLDEDCWGQLGPSGETCQEIETLCADGYDNDGDGSIDCSDSDCAADGACTCDPATCAALGYLCAQGNTQCYAFCTADDSQCAQGYACYYLSSAETECLPDTDNDGVSDREENGKECIDGEDNDADTKIDFTGACDGGSGTILNCFGIGITSISGCQTYCSQLGLPFIESDSTCTSIDVVSEGSFCEVLSSSTVRESSSDRSTAYTNSCSGQSLTTYGCDAAYEYHTETSSSCAPYACTSGACASSCSYPDDRECTTGYACYVRDGRCLADDDSDGIANIEDTYCTDGLDNDNDGSVDVTGACIHGDGSYSWCSSLGYITATDCANSCGSLRYVGADSFCISSETPQEGCTDDGSSVTGILSGGVYGTYSDSCSNGAVVDYSCDSTTHLVVAHTSDCSAGFTCDASTQACYSSCTANDQACAAGYACIPVGAGVSTSSCGVDANNNGIADSLDNTCTDGRDNDGDGYIDYYSLGVCQSGTTVYNCYGEGVATQAACQSYCSGVGGTYVYPDTDCVSATGSSERCKDTGTVVSLLGGSSYTDACSTSLTNTGVFTNYNCTAGVLGTVTTNCSAACNNAGTSCSNCNSLTDAECGYGYACKPGSKTCTVDSDHDGVPDDQESYGCYDGVDNDGSGTIDVNGACLKIDGSYINCLGVGLSVVACRTTCTALGGTYYAKDPQCSVNTDSEGSAGSGAPAYVEEKQNIVFTFFSWLFTFEWN